MHIDFLVEGPSDEEALNLLIPKILKHDFTFEIHQFGGKRKLLLKLPKRLKYYRNWISDDFKIIVLVDRDNDKCVDLKIKLENAAKDVGLITKTKARITSFQVLNRIAVDQLEAWFFGDLKAISQAYPKVSNNLKNQKYREPDKIKGGSCRALEKILVKKGYYYESIPKIEVARKIARFMDPNINRSKSFQVFREGLKSIFGNKQICNKQSRLEF